jgi:hypothetical protein
MISFGLCYIMALQSICRSRQSPESAGLERWLRGKCARHLFAECKCEDINIEQGTYFENGKHFHALGNTTLGKDFICHNRTVTIQDELKKAENVLFQGGRRYAG